MNIEEKKVCFTHKSGYSDRIKPFSKTDPDPDPTKSSVFNYRNMIQKAI